MARMIARKPPMLVRVALANKMARIAWAVMARGEVCRLQPRPRRQSRLWGCWGVGRAKERYGATVTRRDQENQHCNERLKRVALIWT
jgi:hypothetical protein